MMQTTASDQDLHCLPFIYVIFDDDNDDDDDLVFYIPFNKRKG